MTWIRHSSRERFPIRFEPWYALLSTLLLILPSASWIDVRDNEVECRMGWAFRARFPRSAVASVTRLGRSPISRGVHGLFGRWLVNGAGSPIVTIRLVPTQRARVIGFPVRLRELMVSVRDPDRLGRALTS